MSEPITHFDSIRFVTQKEKTNDDQKEALNMFMVNRGFSMNMQTVLFANEANKYNTWSPKMTHDFYYSALPKKKFFAKWTKPAKSDEDVQFIMNHYQVNSRHANSILEVMSDSDLEELKKDVSTGGKDQKKKVKG